MKMPYRKWIKPIEAPITWILILAFCISQVTIPVTEAANPGTTTVSAGSAPAPAATTTESFQPDLFTGRATTSIPIAVPPGRKALQPTLAMIYSSSGRNGWLGAGWGMDFGYIERSTRQGVPKYDSSDVFTFLLHGVNSELLPVYDGTYRAKDEGLFLRFENVGTNGWQVTDKTGTKYLFGRTSASRIENGAQVFRWCLDKIVDPNGNTLSVTYAKVAGQTYLSQIDYAGHEPSGLAPANRVTFTLEDRPDIESGYRAGFTLPMSKRLVKIETYATVGGSLSLARRYSFAYQVSARTGRSLLRQITEVGSDGTTALPPRTFTYQQDDSPAYTVNLKPGSGSKVAWNVRVAHYDRQHDNYGPIGPYAPVPYGSPVVVNPGTVNVDGINVTVGSDGRITVPGAQDHYVHAWTAVYSSGGCTASFTRWGSWDVASLWIEDGTGLRGPYAANLSGLTFQAGWSIIHIIGYNENQGFSMGLDSSLTSQFTLMSPTVFAEPQMAGDVDGNGVSDLINYDNGTWKVSRSQGSTLLPPQTFLAGFGDNTYSPLIGDWNADGRTDVAIYKSGVWRFAISSGSNFTADAIGTVTFGTGKPLSGDFNGDGITDLGSFNDGAWSVALGTRTNFGAASSFNLTMPEGAPVMAPHDVRWTVRGWPRDCMHETRGCMYPGGLTPTCGESPAWTTSILGGSASVGGVNFSVGSDGSIYVSHPQDRYWWAEVAVYVRTARTISMGAYGSWDIACLYAQPQSGSSSQCSAGSIPLAVGWNKIHFTGYHEHQGVSVGLTGSLVSQVDIVSPTIIEPNVSTAAYLTGDFNGDGLTDVAVANGGQLIVAYSDGKQLVRQTAWSLPFGSKEYTTADFNGDGLTDVAYFDRTTGKVRVGCSTGTGLATATDLPFTLSLRSQNDKIQLAEFNGDGLPDLAVFNSISGDSELATSSGTAADLLKRVDNGVGGSRELVYQPSTQMANDFLPLIMPVVTETRTGDGMGNTNRMTYAYSKGFYDSATKEFRGFGRVEARDTAFVSAITEFHQDLFRKGRAFRTEIRDADGNLWSKVERTWTASTPYPGLDCYYTHLDQTDMFDYDGNTTYRQSRVRHAYDAYGNMSATYSDGEVGVSGDERSLVTTYGVNTTNWILSTASIVRSYDATSNIVSQTRFYYDGSASVGTAPVKGNLTSQESWLDRDASGSVNRWIASRASFDAYGNVVGVTDPLNRSVSNTYDTATRTFVVKIENPLGHARTMTYDARYNAVVASADAAGVSMTNEYDALGRLTLVIGPNDTRALPTTRFEYNVSTVPTRATQYVRLQHGTTNELTTHTFFDGLNRPIQVRSPAENPAQQIVTGVQEFNDRGFVARQWAPYLATASSSYQSHTAVTNLASPAVNGYDALGRLISTTQPDGLTSTTSFDDWSVTSVDANGHMVRHFRDAYGQLASVQEYEGTAPSPTLYATTTYSYDALGRMVRLTDAKGNITTTVYDSVGRKIHMTDPDMGASTYVYNDAGGLSSVTDARGVRLRYTYDAMGRTTRKDYDVPGGIGVPTNQASVVYTYDNPLKSWSKGRLTEITDGTGASGFEYDKIGRVLAETLTMDGATYTNRTAYDTLGRISTLTYPNRDTVGYTYNLQGGIETITLTPAGQAAQAIISNINYNAGGQLTKIAYGNGVTSDYSFNPLTWRLDRLVSTGPGGTLQDFTYQFDNAGNVRGITDAVNSGTQSFTYDSLNRLVTATGARYGALAYAYDQIGNMTTKEGVTMAYGAVNSRPHAVLSTSSGLSFTYDASGNMTTRSGSGAGTQNLTYDAENRLVQVQVPPTAPDTVRLEPGWNLVGLPKLAVSTTVTNALKQFGTAYTQVARLRPQDQKFESNIGDPAYNQYTNVTPGDGYWVFCTNAAGATMNLSSMAGTPPARSLTNGWHLLSAPGRAMSVSQWLSPLVSGTDYGTVKGFDAVTKTMSVVDQVVPGKAYYVQMLRAATWTPSITGAQAETVQHVYNGDGGRVKNITAAGTTRFIGRGYEVAPNGKITTYVFAGGQRVAARESTGSLRYYHSDHLGSANVITDQGGARVALYENTPYGSMSRQEGSVDVAHKFTGQRLDAETGLYFFNARYYDAAIGRFIQPDSYVQSPGNPQMLNRYSYALNNPIQFNDPSGHFIQFVLAIAWVAFQGAVGGAIFGGLMAAITGGDILQGMLSGAITGAFTAVGGFVGAMAAGALNAHIQGADPLRGAIAGGFNFLAGAAFHASGYITMDKANLGTYMKYITESSVFGFGTGFVDALIYGASVEDALNSGLRGAAIGAGMAAMNSAATAMQKNVRSTSNFRSDGTKIDTSQHSNGFRGSNDKAAGARWVWEKGGLNDDPGSIFGGTQDKAGKMLGMNYQKGSWPDMVQEFYSGPHDWLNGIFCGKYDEFGYYTDAANVIQGTFSGLMNAVDLFIATPFTASSAYFDQVPAIIHEVNK